MQQHGSQTQCWKPDIKSTYHDSVYTAQSRQTNSMVSEVRTGVILGKAKVTEGEQRWLPGYWGCDLDAGYAICVWNPTCTLMNCTLLNMCIKIFLLRSNKSHPSAGGCNGQCGVWITEALLPSWGVGSLRSKSHGAVEKNHLGLWWHCRITHYIHTTLESSSGTSWIK